MNMDRSVLRMRPISYEILINPIGTLDKLRELQSSRSIGSVLRMRIVQINCRSAFSSTVFVFRVTEARRSEMNWQYDGCAAFYTLSAARAMTGLVEPVGARIT